MCYMKHEPDNKKATAEVRKIVKKTVLRSVAKTVKQNKAAILAQTVKPEIEKTISNKSFQTTKPKTKKPKSGISCRAPA